MPNGYFQLNSACWQQPASEWWSLRTMPWICRMMALLISDLFLLTGLPLGNWLCCCAINPMHFTALGNGTRLFLLPRSVSNGTQPMWRYGSRGCFLLLCCLFFFLLVKVDVLGVHLFECTCSSDRGPWAERAYSRGVGTGMVSVETLPGTVESDSLVDGAQWEAGGAP